MKTTLNFVCGIVLSTMLTGCVVGRLTYIPSTESININSSAEIDRSKDTVWNQLISGLSTNFLANNIIAIDKQSGLLKVSFSCDPEKYLDAGDLIYSLYNPGHDTSFYRFPASKAHINYKDALNTIYRDVVLDCQVNIFILESTKNSSRLLVNILYTINLDVVNTSNNLHDYETLSFNSGQSVRSKSGVIFRSNGELEKAFYEIVK